MYTVFSRSKGLSNINRCSRRSIQLQSNNNLYNEYLANGYIIQKKLFDNEEINILRETIANDTLMQQNEYELKDTKGGKTPRVIWNYLSDDTYGNILQSQRVMDILKILFNVDKYGDIHHFHSKLNRKVAQSGSAFVWHQDYGYWYEYGLLYPHLCTLFIAIDPCTKTNGCLQVLNGSHLMGRMEHKIVEGTGQRAIDDERLSWIEEHCQREYMELNEGDAVFLHCNTLHSSDQNKSEIPRCVLLGCYNKASNKAYKMDHHLCTPINVVPDEQIKSMGVVPTFDKDIFMKPAALYGRHKNWLD